MDEQDPKEEAFHHKGDRLGKFLIVEELGRGSMGVVYKAIQDGINREVALKILPANITLDEKAVRRFHREAEAVGRLSHSGIIQIYDVGTIEATHGFGDTHYFAMELVDGKDFSEIRCSGLESILEATRLAMDAAEALAHAHDAGVIHRDIKPSNIMLDKSGRVLVTDFGLARIKDSASLTSTDAVVGTPKYMSPEQVLPGSYPIDGRMDVYSLGATLYECITGQPPLNAPSIQAFFKAIIEDRPGSPRKLNKHCPHDLATIILRCLEKNPNDRYASAQALVNDLNRFLKGERIKARPKGSVALGLEWIRRHRVIAGLSALAAVTLLATVFLSGKVKRLQQQTGELDLLTRLNTIRTEPDLGIAAVAAHELAGLYPDSIAVKTLIADIHMKLADDALKEQEPNWQLVANYMQRAGKTGALWHLMALLELDRQAEAQAAIEQLAPDSEPALLARARLYLIQGKASRAIGVLASGDVSHPFGLLVTSRALRVLAAKETDKASQVARLEEARDALRKARARSLGSIQWLRGQIQFERWEVGRQLGESVSLRDSVDDISVLANKWWGTVASVWEGMTTKQADNLKVFVNRILEVGGMPAETIAAEIERKASARIKSNNAHEKLIGYLMLGVAHLTSRRFDKARQAFDAVVDDPLEPYALWGQSLVQRALGDLSKAVTFAQQALEFAVLEQDTFKDMEGLARHTALLADDADQQKKTVEKERAAKALKRALGKLKSPGAWVSEILSRFSR